MTVNRAAGMAPLAEALADVVCWMVFYLQRAGEDEVEAGVAEGLLDIIGARLQQLPVGERLTFLQHATERAADSGIAEYRDALLEIAESLGLE